jgi:hypothetical protein
MANVAMQPKKLTANIVTLHYCLAAICMTPSFQPIRRTTTLAALQNGGQHQHAAASPQ